MRLRNRQSLKRKLLKIIKSASKKPPRYWKKINTTNIRIELNSKNYKTVLNYFGIHLFQICKM